MLGSTGLALFVGEGDEPCEGAGLPVAVVTGLALPPPLEEPEPEPPDELLDLDAFDKVAFDEVAFDEVAFDAVDLIIVVVVPGVTIGDGALCPGA